MRNQGGLQVCAKAGRRVRPVRYLVAVILSLDVTAMGQVQSISGVYDAENVHFEVRFIDPSPIAYGSGWEFQLFIDSDNDETSGYGRGFDMLVRGVGIGVELADPLLVFLRETGGGDGPGGWGPPAAYPDDNGTATVPFWMVTDRDLEFDVPLGAVGLTEGRFRYVFEHYHDGRVQDTVGDQYTQPVSGDDDSEENDEPGPSRLTAGTIGVWSMGTGEKYWDDLTVNVLNSEAALDGSGSVACEDGYRHDVNMVDPGIDTCDLASTVGLYDYITFAECVTGPGVAPDPRWPTTPGLCLATSDLDGDTDVDLRDLSRWLLCFSPTGDGDDDLPATGELIEDFDGYLCEEDPVGWLDTDANNSMTQNDALFRVVCLDGAKVLATRSDSVNIHSHYVGAEGAMWSSYSYTGRMMLAHAEGGIGVTFSSRYPRADAYYRLRRFDLDGFRTFHIAPHDARMTGGTTDTGVIPEPNTWYWFKIELENLGCRTEVRAKVWDEGSAEPTDWQVDCYDENVNLVEYRAIADCMASPDSRPSPTPPTTPELCLDAFDFDGDDDVDLRDLSLWSLCFRGPR